VIVTHTRNAEGQRRIYFGGKASVECWIEPDDDGRGWSFHWLPAVTGQPLHAADVRAIAVYALQKLAEELSVATQDLHQVPFDTIAALHTSDPFIRRRMAQGRRKIVEQGFVAAPPVARSEERSHSRPPSPVAPRIIR